jgi:hypothetical protein
MPEDEPTRDRGNLAPPFTKGGKPGPGRPKGSIAQATLEVRAFCRSVVESPEYRQRLYDDLVERKVSPAVELMLWARAFGEVPRVIEVSDVTQQDTGTLLARMRAIAAAIEPADIVASTYDDTGQTNSENPTGAPTGVKVIPE